LLSTTPEEESLHKGTLLTFCQGLCLLFQSCCVGCSIACRRYYADSSSGGSISPLFVCLSVCLSDDILKTDAARITKLHMEMFHNDSWKTTNFGVIGQGHEPKKRRRHGGVDLALL